MLINAFIQRQFSDKWRTRNVLYIGFVVGLSLVISLGMSGCKGTTINPTEPVTPDPTPTPTPDPDEPTPVATETPTPPVGEGTPTPNSGSFDGYADTPDDPTIKTLEPDSDPYVITMDYTGDIDWYKVAIPGGTEVLNVSLTDIPERRDFDIVAYDADLIELENGRSAQSDNAPEYLSLTPEGALIYLQIYSYRGKGKATLTLTTEEPEEPEEEDISHLSYEEVLSTYYPLYPRGTFSGILEHSVETVNTEEISCQTSTGILEGELTIGNYAHVERDLLELTDYIDGWALVVFDGPIQVLEELTITIRVSIFAPELNLDVEVPFGMEVDGSDYLVSNTETDVYYLSESYGDFWSNSSDDIRVTSGVLGEFGGVASTDIFTQKVQVEWSLISNEGTFCSGRARGKTIVDFEMNNFFLRLWNGTLGVEE